MTEAEWLSCNDPERMLEFLKGRSSERKLRLVACACCRRIWHLLEGWSQNAVEVYEQQLDGAMDQIAMTFAADLHEDVILNAKPYTAQHIAAGIVNSIISGAAWALAWNTVSEARRAIRANSKQADTYLEATCQAAIVRDLFGNPFSQVPIDRSWPNPTAVNQAKSIYDDRAFDRLPILADALEDAGCTDAAILAHCRGGGVHVRGCWVVDLLLGKT